MPDDFTHALTAMGFGVAGRDRRRGTVQYSRRPNTYLTQWVHDDGSRALFTWEFDLGDYFAALGWQIGAAETSMQILYPQRDVRVARDGAAVASEIERLELRLSRLDLLDPAV
jgi:hypothetical protein